MCHCERDCKLPCKCCMHGQTCIVLCKCKGLFPQIGNTCADPERRTGGPDPPGKLQKYRAP